MVRGWLTGLVVAGTLLVAAGPASAVIPTGNLLADLNPGTEAGSASSTGNDVFTLDPWTRTANTSPRATAVRYGAPGFPTVAQGQALGGGRSFFAGGPSAAGDNDGQAFNDAALQQNVPVPATAEEDIDSGNVQFTVSGCLGGYAAQDDYGFIRGTPLKANGDAITTANIIGPRAAERGNQTGLLGRTVTLPLPPGSRSIDFLLEFFRYSGAGTYNDAYADNLAVRLSAKGSPPPGADCPPAGGGSGGGGGGGGKQTGSGGVNTAVPISRVGKRLTLKGKDALVKLHCSARDTSCKGTLSLATTGLPKIHKSTAAEKAKAAKLGSAKFTIASGKTKTVKVKLKRSIRKRLSALSKRRLKKLKITATAKIGAESTKFSLGAVRKRG
jgi:CxxC motif-containing protein